MSVPMLVVEDLSMRFAVRGSKSVVRAVSDVSFQVARGETFALVGESGSGKTTVGRLVLRLLAPSAGTIRFDGTEIASAPERTLRPLRRRMQMVFQDPFSSLNPFMTVGEAIAEPLAIHGLAHGAERARRVAALLDLVGLPAEAAGRYPHQFSGGQRQRIAIARAIAPEPEFLVADEAVSALDVSIQAQILNLLGELRERLGLTVLFISHDLGVVAHLADRIGVMYAGRLVETGPAAEVIAVPAHPYTRALVSAAPSLDPAARQARLVLSGEPPSPLQPAAGCPFASRCMLVMPACRDVLPPLRAVAAGRASACLLDPPATAPRQLTEACR
jgi:oligopeptide/dipeptide ABC transporter ATP-binding protein